MKKKTVNKLTLAFPAKSENERLSRTMICALAAQLDVSVDDLADVRCAVSEAVTNAVVHAYGGAQRTEDIITLTAVLYNDRTVRVTVRDTGCGIPDIRAAMEPLYTTDTTGERSGMGFAIMQSFTDHLHVKSIPGRGTTVTMKKHFALSGERADSARDTKKSAQEKPVSQEESA